MLPHVRRLLAEPGTIAFVAIILTFPPLPPTHHLPNAVLAASEDSPGPGDRVIRVVDGDTIVLEQRGRARLLGVDCPESVRPGSVPEPYGKEASEFTRRELAGKKVTIRTEDNQKDQHGRLLIYLWLENGAFFNLRLIERGFAYASTFSPFEYSREFLSAEDTARLAGRGMWERLSGQAREAPLHGNSQSHFYHSPACDNYYCQRCTVRLESREAAESAGFRPHWLCVGNRAAVPPPQSAHPKP